MSSIKITYDETDGTKRVTQFALVIPRYMMEELMLLGVSMELVRITNDKYVPSHDDLNAPNECTDDIIDIWQQMRVRALEASDYMEQLGTHPWMAELILRPFQHVYCLAYADSWDAVFTLKRSLSGTMGTWIVLKAMQTQFISSEPNVVEFASA